MQSTTRDSIILVILLCENSSVPLPHSRPSEKILSPLAEIAPPALLDNPFSSSLFISWPSTTFEPIAYPSFFFFSIFSFLEYLPLPEGDKRTPSLRSLTMSLSKQFNLSLPYPFRKLEPASSSHLFLNHVSLRAFPFG